MPPLKKMIAEYEEETVRDPEVRYREVVERALPALTHAVRLFVESYFRQWRDRRALEFRAAVEGREIALSAPDVVDHHELRGRLIEEIGLACSAAGGPHALGEDAQILAEAAEVARQPAGGLTDRVGRVRTCLVRLRDRDLAARLEPLLRVLEAAEAEARRRTG